MACPPEWDISPDRYQRLATFNRGARTSTALALSPFPVGMSAGAGAVVNMSGLASVDALIFGVTAFVFSIIWLLVKFPRLMPSAYVRALDERDPSLVVSTHHFPDALRELIDAIASVDHHYIGSRADGPPAEVAFRAERLRVSYDAAAAMNRAGRKAGDWSVSSLTSACRAETKDLVDVGLRVDGSYAPRHATQVQAVLLNSLRQAVDAKQPDYERAESEPVASAGSAARTLWAESVQTHDAIAEAYGTILGDPLSALTHSALFDMREVRSVRFIEAYGEATDLRAVHGLTYPALNEAAVKDYRTAVRKADEAWTEALRYSEHITFDWLPQGEADCARKAAGFLAVAEDSAATTHERAAAAGKAADLLRKVKSFLLPPTAIHALEAQVRLELMPADMGQGSGPILDSTVVPVVAESR